MKKVILDVDTGTDDAIAIMLALSSPELEVVGICSVNGNRAIDFTTENTLRVVEYMGAVQVPVHKGCALPMVSTLSPGRRDKLPYTGPEDPVVPVHADIDIGGGASDGQSIFDLDKRIKRAVPNVKVALGADKALFSAMIKEILGGAGS